MQVKVKRSYGWFKEIVLLFNLPHCITSFSVSQKKWDVCSNGYNFSKINKKLRKLGWVFKKIQHKCYRIGTETFNICGDMTEKNEFKVLKFKVLEWCCKLYQFWCSLLVALMLNFPKHAFSHSHFLNF